MKKAKLFEMAQDAGFIVNALREIGPRAPMYDITKPLNKFAKLAAKEDREARVALSVELRRVLGWARFEKAPLREGEQKSIEDILAKYGLELGR